MVELLLRAALPEDHLDALLGALIAAAPHADISDLIYHSDVERSAEQIVDEALFRERMFLAQGVR